MGCSHLLAMVNDTAVNIGIWYLFESLLSVPLGKNLEMESLDHMLITN